MYFFKIIIMRLTLIFTICCLTISMATATDVMSQIKKEKDIDLSLTNASVVSVIEAISKETGYNFFYDETYLLTMANISVNLKDATLQQVFDQISKQTKLGFHKVDDTYTVFPQFETVKVEAKAQPGIRINGKVFDDSGALLPGVTITVSGSTIGTTTDVNGEFSITVPNETSVLQFGFIGFRTQEVVVGTQRIIAVTMQEETAEIEEYVVVAFAKQKKESVTSSITTVSIADLKVPSSNLTTAFAGRISGVISYQRSGEPGQDNADFFVRGITSFGTGKVNPLVLIDGVELSTDDLARLNTDDIASFSVMKDANATALYGARGANGVILVTTKEGVEGKARFSVRFENSFSAPTRNIEMADPITYMLMGNEAVRTRDPLAYIPYSDTKIANTGIGNPNVYPATDWAGLMFKDFTSNQRLNLNISGGGKIARYYVAASYNKDNGILNVDKRNNFNNNINLRKYLLRSNVNINVTPTTEMIVRLHGTFDDYTGPLDGGTGLYKKVMRSNPVLFPAYYEPDEANRYAQYILFGNSGMGGAYINPYADMVKGYKDYSNTLVLAQVELKQNLDFMLKGLSVRGMFNTTRYSYFDVSRYYNPYYYSIGRYDKYTDTYRLMALNPEDGTQHLKYDEGKKDVSSTLYFEGAVQYLNTFAENHAVSGLLIYTGREELKGNAGNLELSLPSRNLGLSGRVTYGYRSKYFVEGNFGYNGSERFDKNHRYGFFPSIGAGYMISNEAFWEPMKQTVSKLKLKATYGLVGNDAIGRSEDRFFYLSNVELDDKGRNMAFGTEFGYSHNGVSISRYSDPNITWEKAYKQNYGIEIGLFNKIEIIADYFRETRKNILQSRVSIPSTMGLQATPQSNIGEAFGSGVDMSVDYSQVFNPDFWVSFRGNFTYATSEYRVYEELDYSQTPWRSHIGQKLSQQWGYIAERLFIDDADVKNSPRQQFGEYAAGDIKYKDIYMDDVIDARDAVPIGYPTTPEIIYGFGFSTGYKGFDLSAFFQGSAHSSFWINVPQVTPFINPTNKGQLAQNALMKVIADSYWSETNRDPYAFWPRLSDRMMENNASGTHYDKDGNRQWGGNNTWFMRNGAFFRLKTAELGYTLPHQLTQKARMEVVRFYLSGTNLWTLSAFKLWDPEMAGNGLGYPIQRVLNIGVNISF